MAEKKNKAVKKKQKKLELLAPAGNIAKLETAFLYGADAVYFGVPDFSLRSRINDFDLKAVKLGIEKARAQNKKAYLTFNIFAHNSHLKSLTSFVKKVKAYRPHAFIASDPGIISILKKEAPEIEVHLSTQANCTNLEAARFWYQQGISRVVLGRETKLEDIKKIHKELPKLELEYFIHGAMCMAYSGRCFLSKLAVGKSANLGDCAQPCRWNYEVTLKARGHEEELHLEEDKYGAYLLNSKDLCLVKHLRELIKAGVISFKIEGRAKSVYYQAVVCSIYSKALKLAQSSLPQKDLNKELNFLYQELSTKLVNRGYTTGFLLEDKAGQNIENSKVESGWEFCGQVITKDKGNAKLFKPLPNNALAFKVHNTVKVGDRVEIVLPEYEVIKVKVNKMYNFASGEEISEAHGGGGGARAVIVLSKAYSTSDIPANCVLSRKINKQVYKQGK